jgi:hypothetical protein
LLSSICFLQVSGGGGVVGGGSGGGGVVGGSGGGGSVLYLHKLQCRTGVTLRVLFFLPLYLGCKSVVQLRLVEFKQFNVKTEII